MRYPRAFYFCPFFVGSLPKRHFLLKETSLLDRQTDTQTVSKSPPILWSRPHSLGTVVGRSQSRLDACFWYQGQSWGWGLSFHLPQGANTTVISALPRSLLPQFALPSCVKTQLALPTGPTPPPGPFRPSQELVIGVSGSSTSAWRASGGLTASIWFCRPAEAREQSSVPPLHNHRPAAWVALGLQGPDL